MPCAGYAGLLQSIDLNLGALSDSLVTGYGNDRKEAGEMPASFILVKAPGQSSIAVPTFSTHRIKVRFFPFFLN